MKPSASYSPFNVGQNGVLTRHLGRIIATKEIPEGNVAEKSPKRKQTGLMALTDIGIGQGAL